MTDENREQAQALLDGTWTEPYRLRPDDIEACKQILQALVSSADDTGEYEIANIQGYVQAAMSTVRFEHSCDVEVTTNAMDLILDAAPKLGQLCKKVLAHWDTGGDRLERLEEFYAATVDADRYRRIEDDDVPEPVRDRLFEAREALR